MHRQFKRMSIIDDHFRIFKTYCLDNPSIRKGSLMVCVCVKAWNGGGRRVKGAFVIVHLTSGGETGHKHEPAASSIYIYSLTKKNFFQSSLHYSAEKGTSLCTFYATAMEDT